MRFWHAAHLVGLVRRLTELALCAVATEPPQRAQSTLRVRIVALVGRLRSWPFAGRTSLSHAGYSDVPIRVANEPVRVVQSEVFPVATV